MPLAAVAVVLGQGKWFFHEPGAAYRTLPEILALPDYAGFELVQGPERPGPYECIGTTRGAAGEAVAGSFGAKGKKFSRFSLPGGPVRSIASSVCFRKTGVTQRISFSAGTRHRPGVAGDR